MGGNGQGHVVRQVDVIELGFALENRHACFKVWVTDFGDEPPRKTATQPLFDARQLGWKLVASENDLLVRVMKSVERVEELVLRAVLAGNPRGTLPSGSRCRRPTAASGSAWSR